MASYHVGGFLELKAERDGKDYKNKSQSNWIEKNFLKKPDAPNITFQRVKLLEVKPKRKAWIIGSYPEFIDACKWLNFNPREAYDRCFIKEESFKRLGETHASIGSEKDYNKKGQL